jgi:hypothetical protein
VEPHIVDYGDLVALTSAMHLLYGSAADPTRDMSFSGTTSGGGGGGGGTTTAAGGSSPVSAAATPATQTPAGVQNVTTNVGGGSTPSGTTSPVGGGGGAGPGTGGGVGGGGGGGGGGLPFTGYPVAAAAGIGTGLVAAGTALRRAVRRKRAE